MAQTASPKTDGSRAVDPTAARPPIPDARIIRVVPAELRAALLRLRDEGLHMLLDIGGVDYPDRQPRFDIVYHLLALAPRQASRAEIGTPERVRVLCGVAADAPAVPSVTDLWAAADWAEREIFDLFGITFVGHPDLRRIQMPEAWEGHPLRKDYPLRGPAREKTPRPSFALKSNIGPGVPAARETAIALQRQIAEGRRRNAAEDGAADIARSGRSPGAVATAGQATPQELAERPVLRQDTTSKDPQP